MLLVLPMAPSLPRTCLPSTTNPPPSPGQTFVTSSVKALGPTLVPSSYPLFLCPAVWLTLTGAKGNEQLVTWPFSLGGSYFLFLFWVLGNFLETLWC